MLTTGENAMHWSRTIASVMAKIENDSALARLIDEGCCEGANTFRVQVRHICTLALVGEVALEKERLSQAVRELEGMCVGTLQRWQPEVRRARTVMDG